MSEHPGSKIGRVVSVLSEMEKELDGVRQFAEESKRTLIARAREEATRAREEVVRKASEEAEREVEAAQKQAEEEGEKVTRAAEVEVKKLKQASKRVVGEASELVLGRLLGED